MSEVSDITYLGYLIFVLQWCKLNITEHADAKSPVIVNTSISVMSVDPYNELSLFCDAYGLPRPVSECFNFQSKNELFWIIIET